MPKGIERLLASGPVAEIRRAGYEPLEDDDLIEIAFANGALFNFDVGLQHATDIEIYEGAALERAFGHLRIEEPEAFRQIEKHWTFAPVDLPWAIGQTLTNPRRLIMTQPYRVEVGYAFDCGPKALALFGEADLMFVADLHDPEVASFALVETPL
jgi:hypothetical protein